MAATSSAKRRSTVVRDTSRGYGTRLRHGAREHLVRTSRVGARVRTTIRPVDSGRLGHSPLMARGHTVRARRTANLPGTTWGVGHGSGDGQAACVDGTFDAVGS
jgi:hypothetical protein